MWILSAKMRHRHDTDISAEDFAFIHSIAGIQCRHLDTP